MRHFFILFLLLVHLVTIKSQEIFLSTLEGRLFSLNLDNCSTSAIGNMPVSSTDISFHPNGLLYAVTGNGRLYEINVMTGGSTLIYTFEQNASQLYTALTISAEGFFYASGLDGDLWRYDFDSDNGVLLGNIGYAAEGDLTFYEGQLYMAAEDDNIVLVDIENPSNSSIAINGNVTGRIFGIVSYAASCDSISVYALTNNSADIYEVDLVNNVLVPYCSINLQVSGGASTFEFLGSNPVFVDAVNGDNFDCADATGTISIEATGGVGTLTYSVNGVDFQASPDFTDLPLADYIVYVADEVGCVRTRVFEPLNPGPDVTVVDFVLPSCGNEDGSIEVEITGNQLPITFTLNGEPADPSVLNGLATGTYFLEVEDANGCSATEIFTLNTIDPLVINEVVVVSTSCGLANGSILVDVGSGLAPFAYSLDEGPTQDGAFFADLDAGSYSVAVTDQAGCTITADAVILPSNDLFIETVLISDADCEEATGRLEIIPEGGNGLLEFQLNNGPGVTSPIFENLTSGEYTLTVEDATGCIQITSATVASSPAVVIELISQNTSACLQENGEVSLALSGGTGNYRLSQNGREIQTTDRIVGLAAGNYEYVISDSLGCTDSLSVEILSGRCPIYLPNAFSPDFDGVNDYFGPLAASAATAKIISMQVYDRWGGLVFDRSDGELGDTDFRWDGTRSGQELPSGSYLYWLELEYVDGEKAVFSGDLTLLRN